MNPLTLVPMAFAMAKLAIDNSRYINTTTYGLI